MLATHENSMLCNNTMSNLPLAATQWALGQTCLSPLTNQVAEPHKNPILIWWIQNLRCISVWACPTFQFVLSMPNGVLFWTLGWVSLPTMEGQIGLSPPPHTHTQLSTPVTYSLYGSYTSIYRTSYKLVYTKYLKSMSNYSINSLQFFMFLLVSNVHPYHNTAPKLEIIQYQQCS